MGKDLIQGICNRTHDLLPESYSSTDYEGLLAAGDTALGKSSPSEAITFYCHAADATSDYEALAKPYLGIGYALLAEDKTREAVEVLNEAVTYKPYDPDIIYNAIVALRNQGLHEDAVTLADSYESELFNDLMFDWSRFFLSRAFSLFRLERYDETIRDATIVRDFFDPRNRYAHWATISSHYRLEDSQAVLDSCMDALVYFPNDLEILKLAGEAAIKTDNFDLAADFFKKFIEFDFALPADSDLRPDQLLEVGRYYYGLRDYDQAISHLTAAADRLEGGGEGDKNPRVIDIYTLLSLSHIKVARLSDDTEIMKTNLKAASAYLEHILKSNPTLGEFLDRWIISIYYSPNETEPTQEDITTLETEDVERRYGSLAHFSERPITFEDKTYLFIDVVNSLFDIVRAALTSKDVGAVHSFLGTLKIVVSQFSTIYPDSKGVEGLPEAVRQELYSSLIDITRFAINIYEEELLPAVIEKKVLAFAVSIGEIAERVFPNSAEAKMLLAVVTVYSEKSVAARERAGVLSREIYRSLAGIAGEGKGFQGTIDEENVEEIWENCCFIFRELYEIYLHKAAELPRETATEMIASARREAEQCSAEFRGIYPENIMGNLNEAWRLYTHAQSTGDWRPVELWTGELTGTIKGRLSDEEDPQKRDRLKRGLGIAQTILGHVHNKQSRKFAKEYFDSISAGGSINTRAWQRAIKEAKIAIPLFEEALTAAQTRYQQLDIIYGIAYVKYSLCKLYGNVPDGTAGEEPMQYCDDAVDLVKDIIRRELETYPSEQYYALGMIETERGVLGSLRSFAELPIAYTFVDEDSLYARRFLPFFRALGIQESGMTFVEEGTEEAVSEENVPEEFKLYIVEKESKTLGAVGFFLTALLLGPYRQREALQGLLRSADAKIEEEISALDKLEHVMLLTLVELSLIEAKESLDRNDLVQLTDRARDIMGRWRSIENEQTRNRYWQPVQLVRRELGPFLTRVTPLRSTYQREVGELVAATEALQEK